MNPLTLDHLVIAVRDLDSASANYRRLLGRAPSWRGRHPNYGTANVLFRLDNTYVELLAPAGAGDDSPWLRGLQEHLDTIGEGLYAVALGTDDIDGAVAAARSHGLEVFDPVDGDGVDLETGATREWSNARIPSGATRGVRAFLIQHRSPADALPAAPPSAEDGAFVTAVDHTVVVSSYLADSLRLWQERFGLDLRRTLGPPGGRQLHFLRLGDSILELVGEAEPERPGERDLLWGVAFRVANAVSAVARLRAAGVEVSDARRGNAPGTVVADLRPGFSNDVRTLLIQHEPLPGR